MKLLSITPVMPYDEIGHAGGKTYNYYIKQMARCPGIDLSIFGFSRKSDMGLYDLDDYGIKHKIILTSGTLLSNAKHLLMDKLSNKVRMYSGYSAYKHHEIMAYLAKLEKHGKLPDIIELEWTGFVLSAPEIKERYPHIKLVASEHDVSFLGAQRRFEAASGKERSGLEQKYIAFKRIELEALACCDLILPQNEKDKALLISEGIDEGKILVLTPYYHDMRSVERKETNHDILFWGAMYREENYEAALWFVDHVMPLLADTDVRFIAAGNRPPEILRAKASDRVIVTGFVEDETSYFAHSMCFVSPLLLGAGIKVKVIEAMSAGIPVLTNDIGIEGIPAKADVNYFHCATAEDYALAIRKLLGNGVDKASLYNKQQQLIESSFNLVISFNQYVDRLKLLIAEHKKGDVK